MKNNITTSYPTCFLRAVELITEARSKYNICSENWCNTTQYKYGIPHDGYYCEVFIDGMDYRPNYWAIEEYHSNDPIVEPFILFDSNEDRNRMNNYDFDMLIKACLNYRRDVLFLKHNNYGIYKDLIWPFIVIENDEIKHEKMIRVSFNEIKFWLNKDFAPEFIKENV